MLHVGFQAVYDMLEFGGAKVRSSDLFDNLSAMAITKKFIKGLKGVENIYTQHQPYLAQTLENVEKGRLKITTHPYVTAPPATARVEDVIIFMVGGVTYEEALCVHNFNKNTLSGTRVILGGTTVHNGRSFIEQVLNATQGTIRKTAPSKRQQFM